MDIEVTRDVIARIKSEALAAHPHECCGILLGGCGRIEEVKPAQNVHQMPEAHFEIDPQALIDAHRSAREGGLQIMGYYHSHPFGPPQPSATDIALAASDGSIWAIAGFRGEEIVVRLWRSGEGGFEPLFTHGLGG